MTTAQSTEFKPTHKVEIRSGSGYCRVEVYACIVLEYVGTDQARVQFQNGNRLRVYRSQIKPI